MFSKKIAVIALVSAFAAPALADGVGGISGGHQMQADLLGLDSSQFSTNELAQIDAEHQEGGGLARMNYIASQKVLGAPDTLTTQMDDAYLPRGRDDN